MSFDTIGCAMTDNATQEARDRILDQIVAGEIDLAIRAYREATGADSTEAKQIVLRLQALLESKRRLNPEDKRFLDDFRAGLEPASFSELLDRPHLSPAKQLAALASYVVLAILTLNVVGALILLITGSLAHWVKPWVGLTMSLLLAGPMFAAFPGILRGLVVRRLGVARFVRSPGFGWEIALGFVLLVSCFLGTTLSERLVWLARARVVELESPDDLATVERLKTSILLIDSSRVLAEPFGTLTKTRRDRHGNVSRSEYVVLPLVEDRERSSSPESSKLCWWVGRADSASSRMQHPILDPDAASPYFVVSPTHRSEYQAAVARALETVEAPDCVSVLERVPPPDELRSALAGKLRSLVVTVNGALWVLLGLWAFAWGVRRARTPPD